MFRHIGIVVSDIYRAMNFYEALGFRPLTVNMETWGEAEIDVVKLTAGNGPLLELIRGEWFNHFAIDVQKNPKNRIIIQKTMKNMDVTFIRDFDKNIIECVREK